MLVMNYWGGGAKPFIQVSTTLTGETADQINSFKSDIQDICDYFNVGYTKLTHLNVNNMNIPDSEKDKIRQLQQHETNPHKRHTNCMEAFDKLSVNWNGDVTLCCGDFDNFMIVGNVLDNDLGQIFLSKAADRYRKIIAADEHKRIHICSTCYELTPLTK